jgi:hypothetical protein
MALGKSDAGLLVKRALVKLDTRSAMRSYSPVKKLREESVSVPCTQ